MADKVIRYKGEFDASQILASLKSIRSEMEKGGAAPSLFKGVDKDIDKAESLVKELLAQINTGFKSTKEVDNFKKKFDTLTQTFAKARIGLNDINKVENFNKPSKALQDLNAKLEEIATAETQVAKNAADAADKLKGISTKEARAEIKKAIDSGEELETVMKRIATTLFSKGLSSLNKIFSKGNTDKVKETFTNSSIDLSVGSSISSNEANVNAYRLALLALATTSISVEDAFADLKKTLDEEGLEYLESSEFAKAYMEDLKNLSLEAAKAKDSGLKSSAGAIGKAISTMGGAGAVDASGNLHMTEKESEAILKYIDLLREKGLISEQISLEEAKALAAALAKQLEFTNSLGKTANEYDVLEKQTDELTNSTRQQVEALQALDGAFDRLGNAVKQVLSLGTAWRTFRNIVSQTFNDVKQLDKAFGSIAMVTKYSVADMWSQYGTYAEMANKLGQSTQSVVEASGLFYQLGLDTVEALKLTEDTMKLATLAGLDFKDATSQMTAALRAFHMEMDQGAHVTDVYAEIAAHAAVDVKGLSEAMSACAAIANSAGMSFENTSAMLATMVEATQEAPKNLGTAMKTILARFTELKNDVAGTAESEFEDLDYNKVDKALKSVGISIKDASGQFRNMDEVLLELSGKWNTLDRNSLRYIATIAAGSRQQSRFIALMENYDRTMELVGVAEESAGKSSEQFAKYQDTVEYKLNRLKNAWEQTRTTFLESDTYKSAIDMLTSIVSRIENLNLGKIIGIGALGITAGKSFVGNLLKTIKGSINNFKTAGANISNAITKSLKSDKLSKLQFKLEYQVELDKLKFELEKTNLANNVESLKATLAGVWDYSNGSDALIEEFKKLGMSEEDAAARAKELVDIYQLSGPNIVTFLLALDEAGKSEEFVALAAADMSNGVRLADEATKNSTLALENYKQKSQKTGLVVGQAFTALANSISMGIMTLLATGDWEDALDTIGTTLLTSAASMGISFISLMAATGTAAGGGLTAAFIEAGGPVALAIIGITAAVGGLIMGISALAGSTNSLEDERKRLEEYSENLEKTISSTKSDIKEHKELKSTLESLLESYDRLNGKISKTEEELEEYDATIKALKEDYSDLIIAYDNENNTIKISNELRERKLSLMKQELELAQLSLVNAEHELIKTTEKLLLNNVAIEYKNNYSVSEENATKIANREKITAAEILNDLYDSQGNLTRNNADSRNEFALKFFGMDYNDLNKTEKEGLKDALDYVFGNTDSYSDWMKRLGEDFKATTEEMRQSLEDNFKKATEHFDDYFTISLESIEEEFGDTIDSTEKTLRAVERAAAGDKKLSDLDLNDWEGSASDSNLENYEKILEQRGGEKLASTLNMTTTSMADAINKIYSAAAEGAWGVEDDYEDFIEGLSETERQVAKAIGITEDTYQNYWENLGLDDDKTAELLGEHLLDSVNAAALTTDADGLSDSIRLLAIDLVNSTADLTLEEYNKRVEELNNTLDADFSEGSEEYKKKIRELNDDLLKNSEEAGKIFGNLISGKTNTERAELYKAYSTYGNKDFVSSMSNILDNSGINKQAVTSALLFEWKDILPSDKSAQLKKFRLNMKDTMGDAFDPKVADNLFERLYENAKKYDIGGVIKNSIGNEQFIESLLTINKAVTDNLDKINTLIETYNKDGQLTAETFSLLEEIVDKLNEAGLNLDIEDLYEFNEQTLKTELNYKALQAAIKDYKNENLKDTYNEEKRLSTNAELEKLYAERESARYSNSIDAGKRVAEILKLIDKLIEELNNEYDEQAKKIDAITGLSKKNLELIEKLVDSLKNLSNTYTSALTDTINNGSLSLSSIESLKKALEETSILQNRSFNDFVDSEGNFKISSMKLALQAAYELALMGDADEYNTLRIKKLLEEVEKTEKELLDETKATLEDTAAKDNLTKAERDLADAKLDVIDKLKAYNELFTGSSNYRLPLDDLYNYTTLIEALEKAANRAKDALDNMMPGDNAKELLQSYYSNTKDYIKYLQAENQIRATSIGNAENTLLTQLNLKLSSLGMSNIDVSSLYTKIGDRYLLDINRLNNLGINDTMKDFIANTINSMNELLKGIEDNNDKIRKKLQEVLLYKKEINNKYVSLEDDMKNALKEKYQQEIDDLKAKYEAMETADNDYLQSLEEAINKLRELRERANEWDDLATKEKKLSLMLRDTSGANLLEVLKLELEVLNDRLKLLDEGIDDVINNLKELYDLQKEERDLEIEYRESLLTDAKLLAEITEALEGIHTADDLVNWYSNITDWSGKSNANIELMKTGWEESFSSLEVYRALAAADMDDTIDSTALEVITTISLTSESLTTKINSELTTTSEAISEAIKNAKKAWDDAQLSINSAEKALTDAGTAAEEAAKKLDRVKEALDAFKDIDPGEVTAELLLNIISTINSLSGDISASKDAMAWNENMTSADFEARLSKAGIHGVSNGTEVLDLYLADKINPSRAARTLGTLNSNPATNNPPWHAFKNGGLADYTGPAWVDGSPSAPEAFLNPEDTRRIGEAAKLLADLPALNNGISLNISTSTVGDTTIALTVNFDSISEEYDAERVIDLMKQKIVEAAHFAGSNVILQQ